jgi:hypothetical protein
MSFAVKYFRNPETVEALRRAGINKPVGYVTGLDRFADRAEAEKLAAHLNSLQPDDNENPVLVVQVDEPCTHACFMPPRVGVW